MIRPEQAHARARLIGLWKYAPHQIAEVGRLHLRTLSCQVVIESTHLTVY